MFYLFGHVAFWMLLALALGAATGFVLGRSGRRSAAPAAAVGGPDAAVAQHLAHIQRLQDQLEAHQRELGDLERTNRVLEQSVAELEAQRDERLRRTLGLDQGDDDEPSPSAPASPAFDDERTLELKDQIRKLERSLDTARRHNEEQESELRTLELHLDSHVQQHRSDATMLASLHGELDAARARADALSTDRDTLAAELSRLRDGGAPDSAASDGPEPGGGFVMLGQDGEVDPDGETGPLDADHPMTDPMDGDSDDLDDAPSAEEPSADEDTDADVAPAPAAAPAAAPAEPDDLRAIKGIGPATARKLAAAGISTYAQLAAMDADALSALTGIAAGRIDGGDWIGQAQHLTGTT